METETNSSASTWCQVAQ